MKGFPLCSACHKEYDNPTDRRFHAQPNACSDCGPQLELLNAEGQRIPTSDPIDEVQHALNEGLIVAIKGIGGYHLVCEAINETTVVRLRQRKLRDVKPLAVMVPSCEIAAELVHLSEEDAQLLQSYRAPIVILPKRQHSSKSLRIADAIAPGNPCLGIMLPYTPIHHLLFHSNTLSPPLVLVVTSGNRSDTPIVRTEDQAIQQLKGIADLFLTHNRPILQHADDSVVRRWKDQVVMIRRSRGFAPEPLYISGLSEGFLAVGGMLKHTFAISKSDRLFLSQHLGDLENMETFQNFQASLTHFFSLLEVSPHTLAYDYHPDYLSTQFAQSYSIPKKVGVWHHHAHLSAAMVDNQLDETVMGIILDGTGYGPDRHIWGGEILVGGYHSFERKGHLKRYSMPGEALAIKEPWRILLPLMQQAPCLQSFVATYIQRIKPYIPAAVLDTIQTWGRHRKSVVTSTSCGRLFDMVASLLGIQHCVAYEAQAAMALEYEAYKGSKSIDPLTDCIGWDSQTRCSYLDYEPMLAVLAEQHTNQQTVAQCAYLFHYLLATGFAQLCSKIREDVQINRVVCSGGVFQNVLFTELLIEALRNMDFEVYTHNHIPPNDGGIAAGQLMIAYAGREDG